MILRLAFSVLLLSVPGAVTAQYAALPAPFVNASADDVISLVSRADDHAALRQFARARSLYRTVASRQLQSGESAVRMLYRIANLFWFDGQPARAARILEEAAADASAHGDLVTQAHALADAALMYGEAGDVAAMQGAVHRFRQLLRSPFLPDHERLRLQQRDR